MTDRHESVVSTQEAPPSSASAGAGGFVPVSPQLIRRGVHRSGNPRFLPSQAKDLAANRFKTLRRMIAFRDGEARAKYVMANTDSRTEQDRMKWRKFGDWRSPI